MPGSSGSTACHTLTVYQLPAALQGEAAAQEPTAVYTVNPDRCIIPAKSVREFEFVGLSALGGIIEEQFVCSTGSGGKSRQVVFDINIR